jgi:beta-lactam-binding protein with PASTA domain
VMPSFVGQPLGSVSRSLQDAGFRLGNVSVVVPSIVAVEDAANPNPPNGSTAPSETTAVPAAPSTPPQPSPASIVVSQAPAAGQEVFAGTTVNFEVR